MATVTVQSPVPGYTGHVINVEFSDGKATVDRSDVQALAYFRRHGYGIDGPLGVGPESPDPREVGENGDGVEVVGTRLRDAAVDPRPGDFLPPTNAGQANPHGPKVVAPGIHATPPAPIVPGPVSSNPRQQEAAETAAAEVALTEPSGAAVAVAAGDEDERPSTKAKAARKAGARPQSR